jgi:hypothetical protein
MTGDLPKILNIRQATLEELKAHDGLEWKESWGELHAQHKEIPSWILLYDDSDLQQCHKAFAEIVMPFMREAEGFQFTVSYKLITEDEETFVDFLSDNDEITSAYHDLPSLGFSPSTKKKSERSIFESKDSSR